jgi:hypothetical protein
MGQSGGDPFFIVFSDSVDKIYASNDICQPLGVMESNPSFFCTLAESKRHCYNGL